MPIIVLCECGKRFSAKDEFAGRTAKCPGCGARLVIGQSTAPTRVESQPTRVPTLKSAAPSISDSPPDSTPETSIDFSAKHRPFVGPVAYYRFTVRGDKLCVHRDRAGASDDWTLPHNIAYASVKVNGTPASSISFAPPREKAVKLTVANEWLPLHECKRLEAWLSGKPITSSTSAAHDRGESEVPSWTLVLARCTGILQAALTAGVAYFVLEPTSVERGLTVAGLQRGYMYLVAGLLAAGVVGLSLRMLWGPILLIILNVLEWLLTVLAIVASILGPSSGPLSTANDLGPFLVFRVVLLSAFISLYVNATRYLVQSRKSGSG